MNNLLVCLEVMHQDEPTQSAKTILKTVKYATLATVTPEGLPWSTPVRFVCDDALNIYWFSNKESCHSQNIRANGRLFIVIYDSTVPEGHGKGVYLQATARELEDRDEIWASRMLVDEAVRRTPEHFSGEASRRAYIAEPHSAWMNVSERDSAGVHLRDYRIELSLSDLRA